jgi:anti-sigma B factor antagonist
MITTDCASRRPREGPSSGLAIVSLHDALDINAAPALRERLTGELHRGPALLVLDLSHVSSCDVVGLAVLIGTQRRARQRGVSVRLVAPSPAAANVLRSTGLERSFTICQDRFGALVSDLDGPAGPAPVPGDVGRC